MNFIAHFYMDRHVGDSHFFMGVNAPDLISINDRSIKIKAHTLPILMENDASEEEIQFYNGVLRHLEVDRLFHTSDFFAQETQRLSELFKTHFPNGEVRRSYFVAHILFELMLDRVMMLDDPSILTDYYSHWKVVGVPTTIRLTHWIVGRPIEGYGAFLKKFMRKKYLYHYQELELFTGVVRRILERVHITRHEYLYTEQFQEILHIYESELRNRYRLAVMEFGKQLVRI